MKIKKDDIVKIIAGKDKGKKGKVTQVFPQDEKVVVDGLNILIKHARARRSGEKGQKIEFSAPLSISNVMLICSKCNKPARLEMKITGESKTKQRSCKKCKNII